MKHFPEPADTGVYVVPQPNPLPRRLSLVALFVTVLMVVLLFVAPAARGGFYSVIFSTRVSVFFVFAPVLALKLWWVINAWSAIPPVCRRTSTGQVMSPARAAVSFLNPFFYFHGAFLVHVGVVDATNAVLAAYGSPRRAPVAFAWIACVFWVIPGLNLFAPFFLVAHMFACDAAQEEMLHRLASGAPQRGLDPPRPPTSLRFVIPVAFAVVGVQLAVVIGAVWWVRRQASTILEEGKPAPDLAAGALADAVARCAEQGAYGGSIPNTSPSPYNCRTAQQAIFKLDGAHVPGWYLYEYERHGGTGQVRIIAYERGVRGRLLATAKVTCLEGKCTSGPGVLEP